MCVGCSGEAGGRLAVESREMIDVRRKNAALATMKRAAQKRRRASLVGERDVMGSMKLVVQKDSSRFEGEGTARGTRRGSILQDSFVLGRGRGRGVDSVEASFVVFGS